MENNHENYLHHHRATTTSAIDLSGGFSAPSSPALEPSDSTLARRRSWGNRLRESGRTNNLSPDPLYLDLDSTAQTAPRRFATTTPTSGSMSQQTQDRDPFYVPSDERSHPYAIDSTRQYTPRVPSHTYSDDSYTSPIAGPSTTSLVPSERGHFEHEMDDGHREDDEAHLTANMSHSGMGDHGSEGYSSNDPENEGGQTPRSRRRTLRYSVSPSPLKKTETAIKSVSKNLRRMSLRVVNLANTGLEGQLRLGDGDEGKDKKLQDDEDDDEPPVPDLKQVLPIRGRTLGFLGSESRVRLALFRFLVHPCVSYIPFKVYTTNEYYTV